jgi:hypothetical protein
MSGRKAQKGLCSGNLQAALFGPATANRLN